MSEKENGKKNKFIGIVIGIIGTAAMTILIFFGLLREIIRPNNTLYGGAVDNAPEIARRTFNSNFTPYEGGNQSSSQVRSLRRAVNESNESARKKILEGDSTTARMIELDMEGVKIQSSKTYTITLEYDIENYVNKIIIREEQKNNPKEGNNNI